MIDMDASEYKRLRESLGTQGQVADLLGVSKRTIANRESGVHPISHEAEVAIRALAPATK